MEGLREVAQSTQMLPLPHLCPVLLANPKFANTRESHLLARMCDIMRLHQLHQNTGPGSVRLRFGGGRSERFRFSVPAVPLQDGVFLCFSTV